MCKRFLKRQYTITHTQKQNSTLPCHHLQQQGAFHLLQGHPWKNYDLHIQSHSHTDGKNHNNGCSDFFALPSTKNPWAKQYFLFWACIGDEVPIKMYLSV